MRSRIIYFLILWLGASLSYLHAQDASEGNYPFSKKETAPGMQILIEGQPKNVEAVVEEIIEARGEAKGRNMKGMLTFEQAQFSAIASDPLNYYFSFENPNRRDEGHTLVSMFIKDMNNQFITSVQMPHSIDNAKAFLVDLQMDVRIYEMDIVIDDQTNVLEKERKVRERLVKDSLGLEGQVVDLQDQILETKDDIIAKGSEIKAQEEKIAAEEKRIAAMREKVSALREEQQELMEIRRRARAAQVGGN